MSMKPNLSMPQRVMALAGIGVMIFYLIGRLSPINFGNNAVATGFILAIITIVVVTGQMKIRQAESPAKRRFRVLDGGRS